MCLHRPKSGRFSITFAYLVLIKPKGSTMKKVLVTLLVAGSLVGGAASSFAAATPKATAKEGTAKHEMSETSKTQKSEAKASASAKPMTTAKAKKK